MNPTEKDTCIQLLITNILGGLGILNYLIKMFQSKVRSIEIKKE